MGTPTPAAHSSRSRLLATIRLQGSSSNKEAGSGKPKEGKKAKEAKPKKAPKVAKPGGDAAGEEYVVHEYPLTYLLS